MPGMDRFVVRTDIPGGYLFLHSSHDAVQPTQPELDLVGLPQTKAGTTQLNDR